MNGKAVKAKLSTAMKSGQGAIRLTSKVGGKKLARRDLPDHREGHERRRLQRGHDA